MYNQVNKKQDGKQDYLKHVIFFNLERYKFQKSYNFPGNTNFERLLLGLFNIKPDCSYMVYHFFYKPFDMQNIPPLEQVFHKGKDRNIAGPSQFCGNSQLLFIALYFQVTKINP